jgi:hypothetical protein
MLERCRQSVMVRHLTSEKPHRDFRTVSKDDTIQSQVSGSWGEAWLRPKLASSDHRAEAKSAA